MKRNLKRILSIAVAVVIIATMTIGVCATSTTGYYWNFSAYCSVSQTSNSISESMQISTTGDVNGTIPQSSIWAIYLLSPNDLHNDEYAYGTWTCNYNRTYSQRVVSSEGVFYIFATQVAALYGK